MAAPLAQTDYQTPPTEMRAIELGEVENSALREIISAWERWRVNRILPPRAALNVRELGSNLSRISLIRVLPATNDYEFRIIGDSHVRAYGKTYQGRKLSDVIHDVPEYGKLLQISCDLVRDTAAPAAYRGIVGSAFHHVSFSWFETCYLPFGSDPSLVDHILNAAVYIPTDSP